ncbi:MAG: pinensin family lanthipeptide [Bacteroidota bacterium]
MKNKEKLSTLKISSFVTSLNPEKEQTVQGGKGGEVPTVVTRGFWSLCCGVSWNC